MALSQSDPTDARRQSLEMYLRARHIEPVMQMRIVRYQLFDLGVGLVNVFGISGQHNPEERSDAAAEQRADVCRHEAAEIEGWGDARIERHLTNVVAIVEHRQSQALEAQHVLDMLGHGPSRGCRG